MRTRTSTLVISALVALSACRTDGPPQTAQPGKAADPFAAAGALETLKGGGYQLKGGPKAPKRVGETLTVPFPAPERPKGGPGAVHAPVLKVVHSGPQGTIGLRSAVTVTFNQAMIPLAALTDLRKLPAPLLVTPKVEGKHRWLGTQTLSLEVEGRLPYSTAYAARVPSGTTAESGRVLEAEHRWTFETPRLEIAGAVPSRWESHATPGTAIALLFNQAVKVEKIIAALRVTGPGGKGVKVRWVPESEWAKVGPAGKQAQQWEKGRVVVVKPEPGLEKSSGYRVSLPAGLVAGEGPLPTTKGVETSFATYGPLKVVELKCGWGHDPCRPGTGKWIRVTNAVKSPDVKKVITVSPAVADFAPQCSGSWCNLPGTYRAQTKYTFTVGAGLEDVYEQKLGQAWSGSLFVGDELAQVQLPVESAVGVTEAKGNRQVAVKSINVGKATVRLVALGPEQVGPALTLMEKRWWHEWTEKSMAGALGGKVVQQEVVLSRQRNQWSRVGLSVDKALGAGKTGAVFVEVHAPDVRKDYRYANPYRRLIVQVTDVGLTVRYDTRKLLVLATGLTGGQAAGGVEVTSYTMEGKRLATARTDAKGLAELPGARSLDKPQPLVVVGQTGRDQAFVAVTGSGQEGWVSGYSRWSRLSPERRLQGMVYTERNPYRPGETVHLTGVLRVANQGVGGGVEALTGENLKVKYWIRDGRYQQVVKAKEAVVDRAGTFVVKYAVPEDAALGHWQFRGVLSGGTALAGQEVYQGFQVLHYRTPEYQVETKVTGEPFYYGAAANAKVTGRYFHGTAMAEAPVRWSLRRDVGSFRPPRHEGFAFGELRDWTWSWRAQAGLRGGRYGRSYVSVGASGDVVATGEGKLGADGVYRTAPALTRWKDGHGVGEVGAYTFEAEVFDPSRQAIASRSVVTVHPAAVYVGLRMKRAVVHEGKPSEVELVVADHGGKRVAGQAVKVVATEQVWNRKAVKKGEQWEHEYALEEKVVGGCSATSGAEVVECRIVLPKAGYYRVAAETADAQGRGTRSVLGVYAVGKRYVPWKQENEGRLELIPDKGSGYAPGETATVLIKSPFARAVGLLTVERNGIQEQRVLDVRSSVHAETVVLKGSDVPNVQVAVVLVRGREAVGGDPGSDLGRPMVAVGTTTLGVSTAAKRLSVAVSATPGTARPGAQTSVKVVVKDAAGQPVRTRLAVMAVDEGVLSLLGYHVPDPVATFWHWRSAEAALNDLRADLLRQEQKLKPAAVASPPMDSLKRGSFGGLRGGDDEDKVADAPSAPMAEGKSMEVSKSTGRRRDTTTRGPGPALSFVTRALFASTAYFDASHATDANGTAVVPLKLPDNLTTFRVSVVALDETAPDRFGSGDGRVTVRRPLMLLPALPRFASFGDRFEAAVKVTNETGKDGTVQVKVEARNAAIDGPAVKAVAVKAGRTEEVRFTVAIGQPGRARFRFLAYLGQETDAVALEIPVNLPATTEAFATYGDTEGSVAQAVLPPRDALRAFGGLDLSFSSTALTGLEDSVRYLVDYPWECTEQTASRMIPIFALRELLPAFRLLGKKTEDGDKYATKLPPEFVKENPGIPRAELERRYLEWLAKDGIAKLLSYQRYDGGFGYWGGAHESWPYPSAYATYALLRAKEAGHAVPDSALARAAEWLSNYLNYRHWWSRYDWYYAWTMRTMAAWVLSEMRDQPYVSRYVRERMKLLEHSKELYGERAKLPLFARAMLMVTLHRLEGKSAEVKELLRGLDNAAIQDTPYKVHFTEVATESLRLLMHSESRTDAIILSALMEVEPEYPLTVKVVRGLVEARVRGVWENTQANAFALLAFSRYFKKHESVVPDYRLRAWLGSGFLGETTFKGRSMRVVEQKVPMSFLMDQGRKPLVLEKTGAGKLYYRLGLRYAPTSLRLPPEEQGFSVEREYEAVEGKDTVTRIDGTRWRIKAGKYVRVRLRIVVPSQRYFVAVDDPLPAGLEAVDLTLKTSASSSLGNAAKNTIYDFHSWYAFFAFSHQEKRDDRVVLFSDRLPSGVYEYTYLARSTTIGTFVVPPLKAEEMYHPEVFGRNGTNLVEVVP